MEKRKRVLVVDNDEQLLMSLERLLDDEGVETTITCSAQHVLELLHSVGFDLLLMGDDLPDLSCEQLLREIQGQGISASILIMQSMGTRVLSSPSYFACLGAAGTVRKSDLGGIVKSIKSFVEDRIGKQARAA